MIRRRHRDDRGAAAVEFALVIPFLLMLLFGMITTAMTYSDHLSASNAVREAARYGAATDVSTSTWATSVRERVKQVYFNAAGAEVSDSQVCVRLVTASGGTASEAIGSSCGSAPDLPPMESGTCAVQVWMQRPANIQLIIAPTLNFDIGAESVAYYGRVVSPTCTAV